MSGSARSLWLPLDDRVTAWCVAAGVLACHAATMARDLTVYDSAELALAASQLGLGHPPGQPLYTMVGFAFAHLPFVAPLVGLTLLSALPAALAVIPMMSLAEQLCPHGRVVRAVVVGGLSLHAALWETASRVEIYALAALLAIWSIARLSTVLAQPMRAQGWYATGLGLGLTAAVNPVIALFVGVAAVPALVMRRASMGALARLVLGGLTGLLPYLYVPLVARRDPSVFVWGAPRGGRALERFLRVADFAGNAGVSFRTLLGHLGEWLAWSARHALLPLVIVGLLGLVLTARHARRAPAAAPPISRSGLGLSFVAIHLAATLFFLASNVVWLVDNPDYLGYLAAPLYVLVACCAAGASLLASSSKPRARIIAGALVLLLVADALLAPPTLLGRTRHEDHVARVIGEGALDAAPPDAIVVVTSDHWVFPMMWLQEAESRRPDVVLLPVGLASSSWYWEHLHRLHPGLVRIELTGPGGSLGRVRRLLVANASRPVLVERIRLAAELGVPVCATTWLLEVAPACPEPEESPSVALERALAVVGSGAPASDATIAQVAYDRGEALWRLGHGASALSSLLAGVPVARRPPPTTLERAALDRTLPLRKDLPVWRRQKALGDPARNLLVAALLLEEAGDPVAARRYRTAAWALELPEAAPP